LTPVANIPIVKAAGLGVRPLFLSLRWAPGKHPMKALYINQLTENPERLRQRDDRTIMGAKMFEWSLLCALLEYGTYDTYFAPGVTDQKKDELVADGLTPDNVKRLVPVPLGRPLPIENSDQVVLVIAGRELNILATLRQKLQRYDAPVCGFIHSINLGGLRLPYYSNVSLVSRNQISCFVPVGPE